jgi:hypothetical protein
MIKKRTPLPAPPSDFTINRPNVFEANDQKKVTHFEQNYWLFFCKIAQSIIASLAIALLIFLVTNSNVENKLLPILYQTNLENCIDLLFFIIQPLILLLLFIQKRVALILAIASSIYYAKQFSKPFTLIPLLFDSYFNYIYIFLILVSISLAALFAYTYRFLFLKENNITS